MKFTWGMACFRDFDGVYFTLHALKLYHHILGDEIIVVDNSPEGCPVTEDAVKKLGGRYLHRPEVQGTSAPRDLVFQEATGDWVCCMDCHVLLLPGAVDTLKSWLWWHGESNDLIGGPMMDDTGPIHATHMDPVWRAGMWGTWAVDPRGAVGAGFFEIPMHGLGLFAMRKAAWPGFNPLFKGFGGEEGYIHEKVRQRGGKCLCLPGLRWLHRFGRPGGAPYPMNNADRIRNYLIGHRELGLDVQPIIDHFGAAARAEMASIEKEYLIGPGEATGACIHCGVVNSREATIPDVGPVQEFAAHVDICHEISRTTAGSAYRADLRLKTAAGQECRFNLCGAKITEGGRLLSVPFAPAAAVPVPSKP